MFTLVNLRRCYPCIIILAVIGLAQIYIFVMNEPFAGYVRTTFMKVSNSLKKVQKRVATQPPGPVHVLLLSYARTGSSFVGDLLQSYPEAFYYFEPLHFIGNKIINSTYPEAKLLLRRLFSCQVSKVPGFMIWQLKNKNFMKLKRNPRYWKSCTKKGTCYNSKYMDRFCSRHSAVVIKTIRMTLREASTLFDEFPELNLKIIYLGRDPRGTMNSRMRTLIKDWCKNDSKCYDTRDYCSTLLDDVEVACRLLRQRTDEFTMVRYEDLSREPYVHARSLAKFLGYNSTKEMELFVRNHTSAKIEKAGDGLHEQYNTFRNSLLASIKWRQEMNFTLTLKVQKYCGRVLEAIGYHPYDSVSAMKSDFYLDRDLHSSLTNYCYNFS